MKIIHIFCCFFLISAFYSRCYAQSNVPAISHQASSNVIIGRFLAGPFYAPVLVTSYTEFESNFGKLSTDSSYAIYSFFQNGGTSIYVIRTDNRSSSFFSKDVFSAMEQVPNLGQIAAPEFSSNNGSLQNELVKIISYCQKRNAIFVIDIDKNLLTVADVVRWRGQAGLDSKYLVSYFPAVNIVDPLNSNRGRFNTKTIPNSGVILSMLQSNELRRGEWKAPAGKQYAFNGVRSLAVNLNANTDCSRLSEVNCLVQASTGEIYPYGMKTLSIDPEYRYVSVVRLENSIRRDILQGLAWVKNYPNDNLTWILVNHFVENYILMLWRNGALMGQKTDEAYFVRCGLNTMTQADIAKKILRFQLGYAAIRPAEFLITAFTFNLNP